MKGSLNFGLLLSLLLSPMAANAKTTSADIEAVSATGPLKGTFTEVEGKAKGVVLILPGSGPTDRDGDSVLGVRAASYRLLSSELAKSGIATVRIDKRGLKGSGGATDGNAITMSDYIADTKSWIASARARSGAKCIWLAGHSEGGLIALASAPLPDICGIILLAAPGRPLGAILREQLRGNPANAPLLADAEKAILAFENGQRVDVRSFHPALQQLFAPELQGYLISLMSYDPASLAAKLSVPMLIIQGQSDLQVADKDANQLKAAYPKAELVLLPDVNHVLKVVESGDRGANFAAYTNPDLPIAPAVVSAIVRFVTAGTK
jgi:uncharacterized protein